MRALFIEYRPAAPVREDERAIDAPFMARFRDLDDGKLRDRADDFFRQNLNAWVLGKPSRPIT